MPSRAGTSIVCVSPFSSKANGRGTVSALARMAAVEPSRPRQIVPCTAGTFTSASPLGVFHVPVSIGISFVGSRTCSNSP